MPRTRAQHYHTAERTGFELPVPACLAREGSIFWVFPFPRGTRLTNLSTPVGKAGEFSDSSAEYPERVAFILRNLAIGRAIIYGRTKVIATDLELVRRAALSSGVPGRQLALPTLVEAGGEATIERLVEVACH
jgi:hypothetical protein